MAESTGYGYTKKTNVALAWMENREKIVLQARQVMRRALNEALAELDKKFTASLGTGKILHLDFEKKELRELLRSAATLMLGPEK